MVTTTDTTTIKTSEGNISLTSTSKISTDSNISIATYRNGMTVIKYHKGPVYSTYANGVVIASYTNGTVVNIYPDGSTTTIKSNGAVYRSPDVSIGVLGCILLVMFFSYILSTILVIKNWRFNRISFSPRYNAAMTIIVVIVITSSQILANYLYRHGFLWGYSFIDDSDILRQLALTIPFATFFALSQRYIRYLLNEND